MIKKSDLKQYRNLKMVLSTIDEEIDHAYNTYKSPQMQSRASSFDKNDPGDPVVRALKRIDVLKKQRANIIEKIEALEQYVNNIEDYFVQGVIRYHYFEGYTWEATCMQFRGHKSARTITTKINNYFASQESHHD